MSKKSQTCLVKMLSLANANQNLYHFLFNTEYSFVIKNGKWIDLGDAATTAKSLLTLDQQVPESGTEWMTLEKTLSFCSSLFVLKLWSFQVPFLSLSDINISRRSLIMPS